MTERVVVAEPYRVCPECPAGGHLTPAEHKRRCYGRRVGQVGIAACGKKQLPTSGKELFPELFKGDD